MQVNYRYDQSFFNFMLLLINSMRMSLFEDFH